MAGSNPAAAGSIPAEPIEQAVAAGEEIALANNEYMQE